MYTTDIIHTNKKTINNNGDYDKNERKKLYKKKQ